MATYFDSSAIVEVLLQGRSAKKIAGLWESDEVRLASILLEAEVVTVLRRIAVPKSRTRRPAAIRKRIALLDRWRESMIVREVDEEIVTILRQTESLAGCRSLDALHLATALLFQQHLDEPLRLCSLDARMREVGTRLSFHVVPE